jgi:hypothetical protein
MPALEPAFWPATRNCPVAGSKSDWRLATSVTGVTSAQAKPRFKVRLLLTRQLSWTKGRYKLPAAAGIAAIELLVVDARLVSPSEDPPPDRLSKAR